MACGPRPRPSHQATGANGSEGFKLTFFSGTILPYFFLECYLLLRVLKDADASLPFFFFCFVSLYGEHHRRRSYPFQFPRKGATKRMKEINNCLISVIDPTRLFFFWQRGRAMWEHFEDLTSCPAFTRMPDSLLLFFVRGLPSRQSGGGRAGEWGGGKDTDGHCLVFSFGPVP